MAEFITDMEEHVGTPAVGCCVEDHVRKRGADVDTYTEADARTWTSEYVRDVCEAFSFDFEFLVRKRLAERFGLSGDTVRDWARVTRCPD